MLTNRQLLPVFMGTSACRLIFPVPVITHFSRNPPRVVNIT